MKEHRFLKRTVSIFLCAILLLGLLPPGICFPVRAATTGYDRGYAGGMAGTGEYKAFGLDVSAWQGTSLDFTRIKNAGYDYVILRAGTSNGKDTCFETYYTNAKAAGLDVGAYYYSYATTVAAVQTDMEDFLTYISGKKFEYPIYFDYEDATQQALSASLSQQICLTAMDMLAAEGYLVGMYTGKYFSTLLPMDTICAKYELWIAHYLAAGDGTYDGTGDYWKYGPTYASQYGMYQFTDSVWIDGYGPYDGDVSYKDYPTIVKTYGFNGYEPELEPTYFDECTFYPSRCTFTTSQDTGIFSEPRTADTGNTSVQLEAAPTGITYTSTGLYVNADSDIFYQVETADGQTGYIYAGHTAFGKKAYDDIKLTGASYPNGHVAGNIFYVTGTISSTYNVLGTAKVSIYSGFVKKGTAVTGGSATVSNNKYVLDGSDIDDATSFGSLSTGEYTYHITVTYTSYYAKSAQELGTISSTRSLKRHYFTVIDSSVDQSTCTHSNTTTVVTAPTCTGSGTNVTSCSVCGLTTKETVAKLGHSYGSFTVTKEATCTEAGAQEKTCSVCADVCTEQIPATGHSWSAATCTFAATCTVCGATGDAATGHSYTTVVTAPGCATEGYTTYTCTICAHSYHGDHIAATGHSWQEATCTDPMTCTTCGTNSGAPLGHTYGSTVTKPTCTEGGYTTYACATCGTSYTGSQTSPTGHTYQRAVIAPGCVTEGYTVYTCITCGDSYETGYTSPTGHSYDGGTCTTCGEADPDAVKDPGLTLSYPTLSFEDEIIYNVYFSVADTTSVTEMGLMLLSSRDDAATVDDAIGIVPGYVTNGTVYLASSEGIAAANMGDTLYFKVYAKLTDGSYAYSTAGGYNAKAYADSILNGSNSDEMKALVVSMLNYGAEAQLYFGHNTDKLVDSALTDDHKAYARAYDSTMMDAIVKADSSKLGGFVRDNANFKSLYPSVSFDGAFAINFYCTPAITVDEGMTLYWWSAEDYANISMFTLGNATGKMTMTESNGQYWGEVAGIAAKEMDETCYVSCVFKHDGQYVTTGIIAYSLGAYCQSKAAADGDAQQAFAQATAVYGYYAKQYFASIA